MPHIVGDEGEKPEHDSSGKAVPDDLTRVAITGSKVEGEHDRHGQSCCDSG